MLNTHRHQTFRERAPHSSEMLSRSLLVLMAFLALASSSRMLPVHEVECFQKQEYCINKCASLKGLKLCRRICENRGTRRNVCWSWKWPEWMNGSNEWMDQ